LYFYSCNGLLQYPVIVTKLWKKIIVKDVHSHRTVAGFGVDLQQGPSNGNNSYGTQNHSVTQDA